MDLKTIFQHILNLTFTVLKSYTWSCYSYC